MLVAGRHGQNDFSLGAIAVFKRIINSNCDNIKVNTAMAEFYAKQGLTLNACDQYMRLTELEGKASKTKKAHSAYEKIVEPDLLNPAIPNPSDAKDQKSWFPGFIKAFTILYIIYSLEIGCVLIILPWRSLWENNIILHLIPQMEPVVSSSFFKGAIVGLGIDNIIIGIHEIIRLKGASKNHKNE